MQQSAERLAASCHTLETRGMEVTASQVVAEGDNCVRSSFYSYPDTSRFLAILGGATIGNAVLYACRSSSKFVTEGTDQLAEEQQQPHTLPVRRQSLPAAPAGKVQIKNLSLRRRSR